MDRSNCLMVLLIVGAFVCVGLFIKQFRGNPMPLVHETKLQNEMGSVAQKRKSMHALLEALSGDMSLKEFRALMESGEAEVVDTRQEVFHRLGHVPGALSLPVKDFQASYAKHRSRLETDKGALVVIYCSGDACEDSTIVRKALERQGHTRLVIFKGGWNAWTNAGFPVERAP